MGKKKPFSAKAKREQLRQKRLAASSSTQPSHGRATSKTTTSALSSQLSSPTTVPGITAPQRLVRSRAPRGTNAQRFRLQLAESESVASRQSSLSNTAAHTTIQLTPIVETSIADIRPYPDDRFSMPRRPPWRYDDTLEQVDRRETAALRAWREQVVSGVEVPPFFERNLETWRQLWRVIERSDVFVLVADIRYPALHFVPDLYFHVTENLQKGMILALNKCDLVSLEVLSAWRRHFQEIYPKLAVAMFSSYPDAKLAPNEHNSELLSKRERRMARSKLAAWGADELLTALRSLDLEPKKKAFLEQWRSQLDHHDSGDEHDFKTPSVLSNNTDGAFSAADVYNSVLAQPVSKRKDHQKRRRAKPATCKFETNPNYNSQQDCASRADTDGFDGENVITIGVVGHPNAGKSSLINGIFRKKVVSTSQTPGHTKHLQTIYVTDTVQLCDCPGLVFPGLAPRELQILAGMFPVSQVREPLSVIRYLAERVDLVKTLNLTPEVPKLEEFLLETDYVTDGWTAWKICEAWAMKRGYRTAKAARLDVPRAANHILRLAVDGRIVLSTVPHGFHRNPADEGSGDGTQSEDIYDSLVEVSEEDTLRSVDYERDLSPDTNNNSSGDQDDAEDYASDGTEEDSAEYGEGESNFETQSSRSSSSDSENSKDHLGPSDGNIFALLGED